jgi:hypothetical protein
MKYIITESQSKLLQPTIQKLIDSQLDSLRTESEDWGMGEMDELDEINSVNKIVVNDVAKKDYIHFTDGVLVLVTIHKNSKREDFDNLIEEIAARVSEWIPNIELYIENIIDDRKFGPGIDW